MLLTAIMKSAAEESQRNFQVEKEIDIMGQIFYLPKAEILNMLL